MGFLDDIKNFFNSKPEIKEATNEPKEQVPAEPVENKQVETPSTNQQSGVEEKHGKTTDPQPSTEQHAQVTQTTQNEQPKPTQQPQESAPQIIDAVISAISSLLKPLQGKDDFTGIAIYTTVRKYILVLDKSFEDKLRLQFDNLGFLSLGNGKIEILEEEPSVEADNVYNEKIFVKILTKETAPIHGRKARITIFHNKGSLKKTEYILDTLSDKKNTYNIGRGELSTKNGVFRENDIVINDNDPNSDIAQLNAYVSSSHANIEFLNGEFMLHAMPSGISNGNATKIIRGDKVNKIETESMLYPLQDGDIIELGRSVYLKFEILQ